MTKSRAPSADELLAVPATAQLSPRGDAAPSALSVRSVLAVVAFSSMLIPLNSTMVAVALPRLMGEFHVGIGNAAWLITGYLIAMACVQPIAGGLGDRYGRRSLILGGLAGFLVASLAATFASSFGLLVLFRLGQALFGALVIPNGIALVRELIPVTRRAGTFGLMSAALGVGAAAGPPLGGVLVHVGDWRAIFGLNVPIAIALLALGWWCLPRAGSRSRGGAFDVVGALLLALVLAALAAALVRGGRDGLALPLVVLFILFGGGLLIVYELRCPQPVVDPRFFASRTFSAATAGVALSNLAMYSTLLVIPQLLSRNGWDSAEVGLALVPLTAGLVLFSPLGGHLADKFGRRWPVTAGFGLLTLASLGLLHAGGGADRLWLLGSLAVAGTGLGLSQSGLQSAAVESVSPDRAGSAAGVFSTGRYLGSIVGSSLLAALLTAHGNGGEGYAMILLLVSGAALLSLLASLALQDWPEIVPLGERG